MKIKSRNRRILRISVVSVIAIYFGIKWLENNNSANLLFSLCLFFVAVIEISLYTQTFLELSHNSLKVKRKGGLNLINQEFELELKNIDYVFYKTKTYDNWELYFRFFWELMFPSGQSSLIIHLKNNTIISIPFDGSKEELLNLIKKLP